MKLNLGCGEVILPGFTGMDRLPPADVLGDITDPLPFDDESVELVLADNVLEHIQLPDLPGLFREVWRVLVPKGEFEIIVPGADLNLDFAVRDPTHVNLWTKGRLEYLWTGGDVWNEGRRAGFPPFAGLLGPSIKLGWAWRFILVK